ncbi:MAG: radical SAM protein [Bacteroidales bacterium]|nr:radical SAM protein [Bacteroidales bacterium]
MKKINEIFYSVQGEGLLSGTAAVFIRFCGCNLSCPFCDTDFSSGVQMSDSQIVAEVASLIGDATLIVLTGGEPTLSADASLISMLHGISPSVRIAMETNGTHPIPSGVDFVTFSPKDQFTSGAKPILNECSELKLVYPGSDPAKYDYVVTENRFLQPCDSGEAATNRANMQATVDYVKAHPQWRISLQTHKILGVR